MPLFIFAAIVSKTTATAFGSEKQITQRLGYRVSETESEALGSFMSSLLKDLPGYSIDILTKQEIPVEHIKLALPED